MAQRSGKPWSGNNKIPTIHEFVERLDKDKAQRDKNIDSNGQQHANGQQQDAVPHKNQERTADTKEVSDPVTGRQVKISNVGKEYMTNADNPMVSRVSLRESKWRSKADNASSSQSPTRIWVRIPP